MTASEKTTPYLAVRCHINFHHVIPLMVLDADPGTIPQTLAACSVRGSLQRLQKFSTILSIPAVRLAGSATTWNFPDPPRGPIVSPPRLHAF